MSTRRARPRRRRRGGSDLGLRILAAIPAVAYAIFIIVAGGWIFAAGVLILGLVCLHELFRMYETVRPVKLAGFLALGGLALAALEGGERQVLLALVAFVPVLFLLGLAMPRGEGPSLTSGMSITMFGVVWVGMAIAHAILLREAPHGDGIIVDILVGTFIGDTGAYLGGRYFGTRPLAPRISPNKTVEGLLIGFLAAVLATWAAGLYQDWLTHGQAAILGVAVGAAAPLGDLLESAVKRDAGTKDAGSLFGAHGGALDRLDAAFFTLVAGYYVWLALM
ncbi:MAG TPA: phosphatidate cytidylyltransferase [Solirubrobacteraceae bacterium]|nr:phosphatidate cytidylyltransferase [Solirubrobacteraceae bacterium]